MSLGEWIIVSILISQSLSGIEYWLAMALMIVLTTIARIWLGE